MSYDDLWEKSLATIELSISKANFSTWFKNTKILSKQEDHITIGVPNGFAKEWLENKYQNYILKALQEIEPNVTSISCAVYSPKSNQRDNKTSPKNIQTKQSTQIDKNLNEKTYEYVDNFGKSYNNSNLNSKYTFDTFVVGEHNELAKAACIAVSENLGKIYNPLFIYGNVGLGKTHLLQSIGNYVLSKNPQKKVLYTTTEKFTSELINSIKNGKIAQFKEQYKKIDLLIIDDVQFLSGKEKTQQEFFHIFNALYQADKQIVISSDRSPKSINTLSDRLKSRFEGGMIVDIGAPDLETRIAILREKSSINNFSLSEESLHYIAENIKNNVRELEGALNRIIAICRLQNKEPTLPFIKNCIAELITNNKNSTKKIIQPSEILNIVSEFYETPKDLILGKDRKKSVVRPRQICMYLLRAKLNMSYPSIGKYLGGRDHTTVLHSFEKISREISQNDDFKKEIEFLTEKLYTK